MLAKGTIGHMLAKDTIGQALLWLLVGMGIAMAFLEGSLMICAKNIF